MRGEPEKVTVVYVDNKEQAKKVYATCGLIERYTIHISGTALCIIGYDRVIVDFEREHCIELIPGWKKRREVIEYTFEEFVVAREFARLEEFKSISL